MIAKFAIVGNFVRDVGMGGGRHCERSEAIQSHTPISLDCRASLAMTITADSTRQTSKCP